MRALSGPPGWIGICLTAASIAATSPAAAGTLTVLHSFTGGSDGANPTGNTVVDGEGNSFGTASAGGVTCTTAAAPAGAGCGVLWEADASGHFSVLVSFSGGNGAVPNHLALSADGGLIGTTLGGGDYDDGLLYLVFKDGSHFQVLRTFNGAIGCGSNSPWVDVTHGNIWAVDNCQSSEIYTLTRSPNHRDYSFSVYFDVPAGYHVASHVVQNIFTLAHPACDPTGNFFSCGSLTVLVSSQTQQNFPYTLVNFNGKHAGTLPVPAFSRDNIYYGDTQSGGQFGWGAEFSFNGPKDALRVHDFRSDELRLPSLPVYGPNAEVWGTSFYGSADPGPNSGEGTIWSMSNTEKLTIHYVAGANAIQTGAFPSADPGFNQVANTLAGSFQYGGASSPSSFKPPAPGACSRPDGTLITASGCGTVWSFKP